VIKPRRVRPGDRIAVVAPASPFQRDEFDAGIAELQALGFEPVYDASVFERHGYLAGTPEVRARAIMTAWEDPSIAALIGVRGGFGSVHLLPLLDPAVARASRKACIGYSDLTTVLIFLTGCCDLTAFHGPMLAGRLGRGADGYDRASLLAAIGSDTAPRELAPAQLEVIRSGEAAGALLGGTLSQIVASLGTPYAFAPPPGHVLFLEDVAERPYRIDRMLTQLRLAGILGRASALVFGEMVRCDEPSGAVTARGVVAELTQDFRGPVLFGFPSGHVSGPAWTLPLGVRTRVVADARPRLVIEEAAVE
jgi:muramoyltetrapeptide carboxypeptidase